MPNRPRQSSSEFVDFQQLFRACTRRADNGEDEDSPSARQARLQRVTRLVMEKELTDVERQTLMLYYGGPHTLVEIAQLTGTNPSTVSRNLRRGKKKLMSVLQYYLFD